VPPPPPLREREARGIHHNPSRTFKMDEEDPREDALDEPRAYDQDSSAASVSATAASALAQLVTIWDCPQLMKFSLDDKRVWTCGWCQNELDGTRPKPFLGWNATKAMSHVCRIPGMCIRLCSGTIPPDYAARYKDLYLRQVLNKEKRSVANDQLDAAIADLQDSAVSTITPANPSPW